MVDRDEGKDLVSGFMMPITRLRFSAPTLLMLLLAVLFVGAQDFNKAAPFAAFSFLFIWMDQRRLDEDRKKSKAVGALGLAGFTEADSQRLRKATRRQESIVVAGNRGAGLGAVISFVKEQAEEGVYQIPACGISGSTPPDPGMPWFDGDLVPASRISQGMPFAYAVCLQGASNMDDVRREVRLALARALGVATGDVPPFRLIWIQGNAGGPGGQRKIWFDLEKPA